MFPRIPTVEVPLESQMFRGRLTSELLRERDCHVQLSAPGAEQRARPLAGCQSIFCVIILFITQALQTPLVTEPNSAIPIFPTPKHAPSSQLPLQ